MKTGDYYIMGYIDNKYYSLTAKETKAFQLLNGVPCIAKSTSFTTWKKTFHFQKT